MKFNRITVSPEVCSGKPCIRGLRFPVSRLLGLLSAGETKDSILKAYPYLETEDIDEALAYAACLADEEVKVIIEEARKQGRVIITADLDFPRILAQGKSKDPGIILFRGGNYNEREVLNLLERVLKNVTEDKIPNSITVVDKVRIRRTPLPIE